MTTATVLQAFTVRVTEGIVAPAVFLTLDFEFANNSQFLALV